MAAVEEAYGSELDDDRSEASEFSSDGVAEQGDGHDAGSGVAVMLHSSSDVGADADRSGSGDEANSSDSDDAAAAGGTRDASGGATPAEQHAGPFKSSDKGAAIAKAFAKLTRAPRDDTGAAILSGSKSVQKRQREEQASEAVDRKAKLLRQEMRRRGHVNVPRRGEDPEADAAEKGLLRTARCGVVRLFNAVAKAQKQQAEQAISGRAKDKQLSKADFLAELRGKRSAATTKWAPASKVAGVSAAEQAAAPDKPAWDALQDDFAVLQSGLKMKDWDKRGDNGNAVVEETMADMGSDSDEDSD